VGVYATEQLAIPEAPVGIRVQLAALNVPVELEVKVTVPTGVEAVPTSTSLMVTVQLALALFVVGLGEQLAAVDVARLLTVTEVLLLLEPWEVSPL
jgi:hypothetical protein